MGDIVLSRCDKLLIVVFFGIHVKHNINFFCSHQEPLSVVACYSLLNAVVDHYFFVICLVVSSIACALHGEGRIKEQKQVKLDYVLFEGQFNKFVVSLV